MTKAKLLSNAEQQIVVLPEDCRFTGDEVLVNKIGDIVMLLPGDGSWDGMRAALTTDSVTDDFMEDRWREMQEKAQTGDSR